MTDCTHHAPITVPRFDIRRWLTALFGGWRKALATARARRAMRGHLRLEDWQLDDIGLTRADIFNALEMHDGRLGAESLQSARMGNIGRSLRGVRRR